VEGLSGRLDMSFVGELFLLFSFSFSSLEIDLETQKNLRTSLTQLSRFCLFYGLLHKPSYMKYEMPQ